MYKVKQSRNRPGVAQRIPGGLGSQISNDIRHMKVVRSSVSHTGHLYSQEIFLILISVRSWVDPRDIVRPEGLCQWQIPTLSGIEPATLWLVAQCLNHCVSPIQVSADTKVRRKICCYHHCKVWGTTPSTGHSGEEESISALGPAVVNEVYPECSQRLLKNQWIVIKFNSWLFTFTSFPIHYSINPTTVPCNAQCH